MSKPVYSFLCTDIREKRNSAAIYDGDTGDIILTINEDMRDVWGVEHQRIYAGLLGEQTARRVRQRAALMPVGSIFMYPPSLERREVGVEAPTRH